MIILYIKPYVFLCDFLVCIRERMKCRLGETVWGGGQMLISSKVLFLTEQWSFFNQFFQSYTIKDNRNKNISQNNNQVHILIICKQ